MGSQDFQENRHAREGRAVHRHHHHCPLPRADRRIALTPTEYLTVQKIYAGWSLLGVVVGVALLATLAHTLLVRADRTSFAWSLGAFVALAGTQGLFWAFTYPVNAATVFWTVPPDSFELARRQWEYSHAASAVLTFAALVAIVLAVLVHNPSAEMQIVQPAK